MREQLLHVSNSAAPVYGGEFSISEKAALSMLLEKEGFQPHRAAHADKKFLSPSQFAQEVLDEEEMIIDDIVLDPLPDEAKDFRKWKATLYKTVATAVPSHYEEAMAWIYENR